MYLIIDNQQQWRANQQQLNINNNSTVNKLVGGKMIEIRNKI